MANPSNDESGPLKPGVITQLIHQQHDPSRVSVFVEDDFAFGISLDVLMEFGLHKGQLLDLETQHQILYAEGMHQAKRQAMNLIATAARTVQEVRRKLIQKGFDPFVIEAILEELVAKEYLDDRAYAQHFVEGRFRNKSFGPQRLRADLQRRGVAPQLVEEALQKLEDREDLEAAARHHAEKRWRQLAGEDAVSKKRKKVADYLMRRGFTTENIRRALDACENAEDQDA